MNISMLYAFAAFIREEAFLSWTQDRRELEENVVCDVCGAEVSDALYRCGECGKTYCQECAQKDGVIKELGVCSDCEEVYEGEEDYWGWK